MTRIRRAFLVSIAILLSPMAANAALITSNLVDPKTIDFTQFISAEQFFVSGPVQVGQLVGEDIELSDPQGIIVLAEGGWDLVANGFWDNGIQGFAGLGAADPFGSLIFAFNDGPISEVGAFMNYCPFDPENCLGDLIISALDASMNVLETYNITQLADIATPGAINDGEFRGISRTANDISYFTVTGAFVAVDDLAFTRVSVPEPGILALLGIGLFGMGMARRNKKA